MESNLKPTKIITGSGFVVFKLYGPVDEARLTREQAILKHRESQLSGRG